MGPSSNRKTRVGSAAIAALSLVAFQNCSPVKFSTFSVSKEDFLSSAVMTINNGAAYTTELGVNLQINAKRVKEMYVTNDPTCETGGVWESYRDERLWQLGQQNGRATVYAKFKTEFGAPLSCIDASIIHDNVAPIVEITDRPKAFERLPEAIFSFRGEDAVSGIDRFECKSASGQWVACASPDTLTNLPEGSQTFLVRAVDRAGNLSIPDTGNWFVDRTPPTVRFTEVPAPLSNRSSVAFRFEAEDAGSGIDSISCQFDTDTQAGLPQKDCVSPTVFSNLGSMDREVRYRFWLWADDKAGNQSTKIYYDFVIDRMPSGAFQILGVSGGNDTKFDNWLGTVPNPTIHWTQSNMAVSYTVSVLNQAGNAPVCPERMSTQTMYGYDSSTCSLVDGGKYKARVVAFDANGNQRAAPLFDFTVDLSPPTIKITGPVLTNSDKDAEFDFEIDDPSGIETATCRKGMVGMPTTINANCKDLTEIKYANLQPGDHNLSIVARDNAGNTGTAGPTPWKVNLIVCDPFSNMDSNCKGGLKGNLWYLSQAQRQTPFQSVDRYINEGIMANVNLYMSQLAVPTTPWTAGFKATDGTIVRDNQGQILYEYFAMRFETILKLDATKNAPGRYQFAVLSDDGTLIDIKDSPTGAYRSLINNDGDHPTRLACDLTGLNLTSTSRIPMRIKYYQGPRRHISLKLLWRPMPTNAAMVNDPLCGQSGNDLFYGPIDSQAPDLQNYAYGELLRRGWRPLDAANFVLPEPVSPSTSSSTLVRTAEGPQGSGERSSSSVRSADGSDDSASLETEAADRYAFGK